MKVTKLMRNLPPANVAEDRTPRTTVRITWPSSATMSEPAETDKK
jgi:hypothetical protein